jgi:hypothetical protein
MIKGAIPDDIPKNLPEQILLQDAKAQPAIMIQGGPRKPLGDAPRLVANYGGKLEDWYKMASNQSAIIEGAVVEIHWYRNARTLENVEYKIKRTYPKISPKNQ